MYIGRVNNINIIVSLLLFVCVNNIDVFYLQKQILYIVYFYNVNKKM